MLAGKVTMETENINVHMPNSQPTGISTNINIGLPLHNQPLNLNKIWD